METQMLFIANENDIAVLKVKAERKIFKEKNTQIKKICNSLKLRLALFVSEWHSFWSLFILFSGWLALQRFDTFSKP